MSPRALLLYDRDCQFCNWLTTIVMDWDRADRISVASIQSEQGARVLADLTLEQRLASLHFIDPEGRRHSGGAALPPLLALLPAGNPLGRLLSRLPGPVDWAYDWVAGRRMTLSRFVPRPLKRRAVERLAGR